MSCLLCLLLFSSVVLARADFCEENLNIHDLKLSYSHAPFNPNNTSLPVEICSNSSLYRVSRILTGSSQTHGTLISSFLAQKPSERNNGSFYSISEYLPLPFSPFLSTLRFIAFTNSSCEKHLSIQNIANSPIERCDATNFGRNALHILFTFAGPSHISFRIEYDVKILHQSVWSLPPNIAKGLSIGSTSLKVSNVNCSQLLESAPFFSPVPQPDFSMPYNVITLSCTIVSFVFGAIFSFLQSQPGLFPLQEFKDLRSRIAK
eukprot:GCRY01001161.1.p1 GENE.GCRY01001161.1~~GCRY01001161.1.p1  ORF type:complete len:262 (+),score=10.64 GCRY01001161.1:206-991(+)